MGSVVSDACLRYFGQNENKSATLCNDVLGSNILTGNEMWVMVSPFMILTASYLTTSTRTPFCLSIDSLSTHIKSPFSLISNPRIRSSFSLGSGFKSSSSDSYFAGGAVSWYGWDLSTNEFFGTAPTSVSINGLFFSSEPMSTWWSPPTATASAL